MSPPQLPDIHPMHSHTEMTALTNRFRKVLEHRLGTLACFRKYGVQVEGWLKGELLYFLDCEKSSSRLRDFDKEVSFGQRKKRIDIWLKSENGEEMWVELKHWLIGDRKGMSYDSGFYFRDQTFVGIKPDVEKLQLASGHRYLLILTTGNPGLREWTNGVEQFNRKFAPLRISSLTDPRDFPDHYFLGLLMTE